MKKRLDVLLVEKNICLTREKAKRNIMAGNVYVNNILCDKPGTMIDEKENIILKNEALKYVSRGGLKLEKAIMEFRIDLKNKTCMDIGASTGGFTDCMLQNGAKKVYSIDVGYGQLDWKLRNDSRVVCMERTNFRYIDSKLFENNIIEFASIDVSFISLRIILPVLVNILPSNNFDIVALIKPQFEAGREEVKKNGVIRDKEVHKRVINEIIDFAESLELILNDISFSPITGPKGNIEFLVHLRNKSELYFDNMSHIDIDEVVEKAHESLI